MKTFFALVLLILFALGAPLRAQQSLGVDKPTPPIQTGGEIAARAAVEVWLALVDDGQFEKSWESAAGVVQKAVPKEQWVKVISDHRPKLGKVLSRVPKSSQFSTSLPGAPEGQYVVLKYATAFEHKQAAVETITCMLDASGQWKVSGYFVQ